MHKKSEWRAHTGNGQWHVWDRLLDEITKDPAAEAAIEALAKRDSPTDAKEGEPVSRFLEEQVLIKGWTAEQIRKEIVARKHILDVALRQIDYQISRAAVSLEDFRYGGILYIAPNMRRNHIERELTGLRKERRSTIVKAWDDLASLRKLLRDAETEYRERQRYYSLG